MSEFELQCELSDWGDEMAKIALSRIHYNLQNPRFSKEKDTPREALEALANVETIELARHIAKHGLNPTKRMAVFKSDNRFITAEGNRRLAALKLLMNHALLDSISIAKPIRNELKKTAPAILSSLKTIDCAVFESEQEAAEWVRLEHTGKNSGIGTVPWNREQQRRHDLKFFETKSPELQTLDFMRRIFQSDTEISALLPKLSMTPVERLLNDPDVRDFLGIELKDKLLYGVIPEKELQKPFRKIIYDVTNPDSKKRVNTRTLNSKTDRQTYLHSFSSKEIPSHKIRMEPWALDTDPVDKNAKGVPATKQTTKTKTKSVPSSELRKKLLNPTCILHIDNHPRINDLYHNLKDFEVDKYANAVSVIARLFIEMTANHYLKINMGKAEDDIYDQRYKLGTKLQDVVSHLRQNGKINGTQKDAINKEFGNINSTFHPNSLNAFVHNPDLSPSASDLKRGWNNIEPFVAAIWA